MKDDEFYAKRKLDMEMNLHGNMVPFNGVRRRAYDVDLHVGAIGGQLRIGAREDYNKLDIDAALSSHSANGVQVTISLADLFLLLEDWKEEA